MEEQSDQDEQQSTPTAYTYKYVSPLEKEIQRADQECKQQQVKCDELTADFLQYTENFPTPSGDTSKSLCGNCHFRVGHKKSNCKSDKECASAEICGQMKFHPEEKQILAKKAKAKAEAEARLKEAEEGLKATLDRVERLNSSFERVMMTPLVRSNPEKYLKTLNNTNYEKWDIINQDMEILRSALKNKVPHDKDSIDISAIMQQAAPKLGSKMDAIKRRMCDDGITFPSNNKQPKASTSPPTPQLPMMSAGTSANITYPMPHHHVTLPLMPTSPVSQPSPFPILTPPQPTYNNQMFSPLHQYPQYQHHQQFQQHYPLERQQLPGVDMSMDKSSETCRRPWE